MRYLVLAAVAAAFVGACAGQARAALPPPPNTTRVDTLVFETGVTEMSQVDPYGGAPTTLAGVVYPSGCKQVDVYAIAKSAIFSSTIYKFHQIKYWCWHLGVVYNERHSWQFQGSSTACFDSVYPPNSWFFNWKWGKAQSGHFSEERAHVTNCIFKIGSWKEMYPDVQISAHADGSYTQSVRNQ